MTPKFINPNQAQIPAMREFLFGSKTCKVGIYEAATTTLFLVDKRGLTNSSARLELGCEEKT
jgi:hypothetical protein